ncbi:MAG: DUF4249 domain-containing protein [Cyclobacteriaceae bacterium]|mgnify:CR=1 FL=1|nr:DUF4249 domain-containing protein [Cyclobacteriaceae bacterium]
MSFSQTILKLLVCSVLLCGCIDPYKPAVKTGAASQLVVTGYLNSQDGSAKIQLSNSQDIYNSDLPTNITGAQVTIESDAGGVAHLTETSPGSYELSGQPVDPNKKYRLTILTSDGERYESAYSQGRNSPAIDSVTWSLDDFKNGVDIKLFTHDESGQTKFYRWDYEETWQYHSAYQSVLYYDPATSGLFRREDDIYNCWHTVPGFKIITASTSQLTENKVPGQSVVFIPRSSPKLLLKYSVLIRQFAISEDEYNYWENLRKNTENLGTLFDPLPSQLTGNILCTSNPNKLVIGYFSVLSATEKRLFIDGNKLPTDLTSDTGYQKCTYDTLLIADIPNRIRGIGDVYLFIGPVTQTFFTIGFSYSTKKCVDCRLTGGTTTRPAFW